MRMARDFPADARVATDAALTKVFREEAGRLTAGLVRFLGDFDLGEELVQEAVVEALEHWPAEGIPDKPGAWLLTTARRKALDRIRRKAKYQEKLSLLVGSQMAEIHGGGDDRLQLIFTCCHPALAREAQVALTLRAVMGLTTPEIASAFLTTEPTMAQRIVRAKRKIVEAGIPYRVPDAAEMGDRLGEVLAVLYLTFNEGYLASSGATPERRELAEDALWLTNLLVRLMPDEPEAIGLLALMRLHLARAQARFDTHGGLVLLKDQDRSRWDHAAIKEAADMTERVTWFRRPGPYQIQAAIAACHAEAPTWEATDWPQIYFLYNSLERFWPTPVVRLNRAIALFHVAGPIPALEEVDRLVAVLGDYHLFHATRAQFLRALDRNQEARAADARALELATNPAERALIEQRLGDL
jgi:RNA polymerase sigma-70 factor (ECF subfamily)